MIGVPPPIGAHLAVLNLFREPDGSLQITVADASGFIRTFDGPMRAAPIHYVEQAIVEAAANMAARIEQSKR